MTPRWRVELPNGRILYVYGTLLHAKQRINYWVEKHGVKEWRGRRCGHWDSKRCKDVRPKWDAAGTATGRDGT